VVGSKLPGRTPPQIGEHNLRVTLEAIRRDGPLTRAELGLRSGLSGPGITNILRRLRDDGLIAAQRRRPPGGGQPMTEFALVPAAAYGIGVAIHAGCGEAVLIDLGGTVHQRRRFAIGKDPAAAIAAIVRNLGIPESGRVLGVGIGADRPELLSRHALGRLLPSLPTAVERDCVTALFAERTLGVGAVEGGVMLIVVNDGVRAGFMFRGIPFAGVHGRAGSIGTMHTGPDHVPLDSVVGLGTLRAVMTEAERQQLCADGTLELSPPIRAWIRNAAGHLLDVIVATAGFLAPGAILLGGDIPANLIDELIRQMSIERGDTAIRPFITPWISPIRRSSFPGAGIAVGAALLPFFDVLLPSPAGTG
jgi:predicted NBD/HSP70 family sugar kinase